MQRFSVRVGLLTAVVVLASCTDESAPLDAAEVVIPESCPAPAVLMIKPAFADDVRGRVPAKVQIVREKKVNTDVAHVRFDLCFPDEDALSAFLLSLPASYHAFYGVVSEPL